MKVSEVDLIKNLTTTFFDPDPNRLNSDEPPISERRIPLKYTCENCGEVIHFNTNSFEKHCNSKFSNLTEKDNEFFNQFIKSNSLNKFSFLDFYCSKCNRPTKFIYEGGPSGFWGQFYFKIKYVLTLTE